MCLLNPLSANPHKMVKHTQKIRGQFAKTGKNCKNGNTLAAQK